jgi:hypothetical protein
MSEAHGIAERLQSVPRRSCGFFLLLTQGLLNAAKVVPSSQVELPNAARSRPDKEIAPQGLKPSSYCPFSARLKSCPDTKHFSKMARNRLIRALVLQSSIKPLKYVFPIVCRQRSRGER